MKKKREGLYLYLITSDHAKSNRWYVFDIPKPLSKMNLGGKIHKGRLHLFETIAGVDYKTAKRLAKALGVPKRSNRFEAWMNTPKDGLGGMTPKQWVNDGEEFKKVFDQALFDGHQ